MWKSWLQICAKINKTIENCFEKWGRLVWRRSGWVVSLSLLISIGLCAGLVRMKTQRHGIRLWYPQNSEAFKNLDEIDKYFPMHVYDEDFSIVPPDGVNGISEQVFEWARQIKNEVLSIQTDKYTFDDICLKSREGCIVVTPVNIVGNSTNLQESLWNAYVNQSQMMQNGRPAAINFPGLLGKLSINKTAHTIFASAVRTVFPIHAARDAPTYDRNSEVEDAFQTIMRIWKSKLSEYDYELVYNTASSQDKSISDNSGGDIKLIVICLIVILVLCIVFMVRIGDIVHSHVLMGLCTILTIVLGIGSGFGIVMACGQWYVSFVGVLPILVLAVGADNMFIIIDRLYVCEDGVKGEDRFAETIRHVGATITMTMVTDLVAFAIGTVSDFPSVIIFCQFAALALTMTYLMTMTFFLGVLSYDIRRVESGRWDCLPCVKGSGNENAAGWKRGKPSVYQKVGNLI